MNTISERDSMVAYEQRLRNTVKALEGLGRHRWAKKLQKEADQVSRWLDTVDRGN